MSINIDVLDLQLSQLARSAFHLGLLDGRERLKPRDRYELKNYFQGNWPADANRIVHTRKIRQVYGAGFDISRTLKRYCDG
jgi:hypothetical protein